MTGRQRVAGELLVLGVLATGFLLLVPARPILLDLGLALVALALIGANASFTKRDIWGAWPVDGDPSRKRRAVVRALALTSGALVLLLVAGLALGYREGGWPAAGSRILNGRILLAILLFLPWAAIQQTLFQFYLLGRVRALFPAWPPAGCALATGLVFGLVHLPDPWLTPVTAAGGTAWSFLYLRDRLLWPLAMSHAILGATFYYWVQGRDLVGEWSAGQAGWLEVIALMDRSGS